MNGVVTGLHGTTRKPRWQDNRARCPLCGSALAARTAQHPALEVSVCFPPAAREDAQLSPREQEVLWWVARGYSNKRIGTQLGISVHTVTVHLTNIFKKLQVQSRTEAAAWYFFAGRDSRGSRLAHEPAVAQSA